jgi:hypothetical protein
MMIPHLLVRSCSILTTSMMMAMSNGVLDMKSMDIGVVGVEDDSSLDDQHDAIRVNINYLEANAVATARHKDAELIYYKSEPGEGKAACHNDEMFRMREVSILNGRRRSLGLDREGFCLVEHFPSRVLDFFNDDELLEVYNDELRQLLLEQIKGAKRVEIFDHTRRSSTAALQQATTSQPPATMVHCDYTETSAMARLAAVLEKDSTKDDETEIGCYAIVNVWRSIDDDNAVESWPMAFCDCTTVPSLVSIKSVGKGRVGELQLATFHENLQWYYFPRMTKNEAVVFINYESSPSLMIDNDSDGKGHATSPPKTRRFTLHTSFDIGTTTSAAANPRKPRKSIDSRAMVFF